MSQEGYYYRGYIITSVTNYHGRNKRWFIFKEGGYRLLNIQGLKTLKAAKALIDKLQEVTTQ